MPPSDLIAKKVPRRALMFAAEFAPTDQPADRPENGPRLLPFSMIARTGGIAQHPWWGRCIHDFEGMLPAKPTVSVDYCHNPDDIIGFSDQLELADNALRMAGSLVSLKPGDRAEEVYLKRQAGVPYEASILTNWDGLIVESVADGMATTVNGQTVEGPVNVFRKWQLWGVAVCPYGSDADTDIQFAAGVPGEVQISFLEGNAMSGTPAPGTPAPALVAKTGKDYLARFGQQKGALWFAEGKSWEESLAQFEAEIVAESEDKDKEIAELKGQLSDLQAKYDALVKEDETVKAENAAFKRGTDPVSGGGTTPPGKTDLPKQFQHMSPRMAAFAGSIRLPGQPPAAK